ncbi:MAG TPA: glycoside hydrolase family 172 protein [Chthonomonadaceae bacterium]|nr:glycoside hydrolase family 172 protein [Chthonomonadaceae bacterium]
MNLYEKPRGIQTRWFSFENADPGRGRAGLENKGAKGHAFDQVAAGETKTLLDVKGSGTICRIWLTVSDRSPQMLRSLRLDMTWDHAAHPAVSAPLGDFFGVGLGRRTPFECALFSDPEGRSFNCFIPMPFRSAARITLTNESGERLPHLFYDVDLLMDVTHTPETLYFHTHWRREAPNALGAEYTILPRVQGSGRFLGCNLGVIADARYEGAWWGEGEVKCRFGEDALPTLCGTGTEDYIGTGWGQGSYAHRTQGCLIADRDHRQWAFYRYHTADPIYFDDACEVTIQTIGGTGKAKVIELQQKGVPLIPVSIDTGKEGGFIPLMDLEQPVDLLAESIPEGWCNFWRQDDWSSTAYFYLDSPESSLPPVAPAAQRSSGLLMPEDPNARHDTV